MMTFGEIGQILRSTDERKRQEALKVIADWWINQCLLFGAHPETAYRTAAVIIDGMDREFRGKSEKLT